MQNKKTIFQLIFFLIVGVINTAIDFGILNLLMWATGIASGYYYSLFKTVSFLAAVTNSYFMNRYWTFAAVEKNNGKEFFQFMMISLGGFFVNVFSASLLVNYFPNVFGLRPVSLGNLGALAGTLFGLIWNFVGYKYIVFKK